MERTMDSTELTNCLLGACDELNTGSACKPTVVHLTKKFYTHLSPADRERIAKYPLKVVLWDEKDV